MRLFKKWVMRCMRIHIVYEQSEATVAEGRTESPVRREQEDHRRQLRPLAGRKVYQRHLRRPQDQQCHCLQGYSLRR